MAPTTTAPHAQNIAAKADRAVQALRTHVAADFKHPAVAAVVVAAWHHQLDGAYGDDVAEESWTRLGEIHDTAHGCPKAKTTTFDSSRPLILAILNRSSFAADPFVGLTA